MFYTKDEGQMVALPLCSLLSLGMAEHMFLQPCWQATAADHASNCVTAYFFVVEMVVMHASAGDIALLSLISLDTLLMSLIPRLQRIIWLITVPQTGAWCHKKSGFMSLITPCIEA